MTSSPTTAPWSHTSSAIVISNVNSFLLQQQAASINRELQSRQ